MHDMILKAEIIGVPVNITLVQLQQELILTNHVSLFYYDKIINRAYS